MNLTTRVKSRALIFASAENNRVIFLPLPPPFFLVKFASSSESRARVTSGIYWSSSSFHYQHAVSEHARAFSLREYKVALLRVFEVVKGTLCALIQTLVFVNNERND